MKTERNNLDHFKGKNPFTVPEGYMEGLTANIMSQLPEKSPKEEAKKVSLMDRVRPWLYMAAVFAGLGLFFKVLVGDGGEQSQNADSLLVKSNVTANSISAKQEAEDEDYLEYLEDRYAGFLLTGDISVTE